MEEGRRRPDDDELREIKETLEVLGLETLLQRGVELGVAGVVSKLEAINMTLGDINDKLTAIEGNEASLGTALNTIATNIAALKDQLNGATGGLSADEAAAIAARLDTDAATLQSLADQANAVAQP